MYKYIVRPILFLFDAEKIHHFTFQLLKIIFKIPFAKSIAKRIFDYQHPTLERNLFGLHFKNPVGLAAGFDKNAILIDELACFGFGFIEIGTVTPKPQPGNDQPRLFRLIPDQAIINRMGFNNEGLENIITRLKKKNKKIILGGNIGKNKITPNEEAILDYELCFEALFDYVDYFVVNVSSPNTPNLRALQEKEPLEKLLKHLQQKNNDKPSPKPILLKIAPDLTETQLDEVVEVIINSKIAGLIATNTTIDRENLQTSKEKIAEIGAGGLSGKPLRDKSTEVIRYISKKSNQAFPIIAVGGIMNEADAIEKLQAGASLIQIYTGFIYEGPALVNRINRKIVRLLPV